MTNSRDLGLRQNGKGSANRSSAEALRENFPDCLTGDVSGFVRRGQKLVKRYGGPAPVTIKGHLAILNRAYLPEDMRPEQVPFLRKTLEDL